MVGFTEAFPVDKELQRLARAPLRKDAFGVVSNLAAVVLAAVVLAAVVLAAAVLAAVVLEVRATLRIPEMLAFTPIHALGLCIDQSCSATLAHWFV